MARRRESRNGEQAEPASSGSMEPPAGDEVPAPDGLVEEAATDDEARGGPASLAPGETLSLETYLARPHVLVASGEGGMAAEVDAALAQLGQARRIAVRVPYWTVAADVVLGTDVILTVAQRALRGSAAQGLAQYSVPFAIAPFAFEAIRHRRTDGDAGIAWLRAAVATAAGPG